MSKMPQMGDYPPGCDGPPDEYDAPDAPDFGDCEHCMEADRELYPLDDDNPDSPWVCEMCSNILPRDFVLKGEA